MIDGTAHMNGREFKTALFGQFAQIAMAFASPPRIEIVDVLAQGERSVDTLARETGLSVANTPPDTLPAPSPFRSRNCGAGWPGCQPIGRWSPTAGGLTACWQPRPCACCASTDFMRHA